MRWLPCLKACFMWFGVLCAILIPLLVIAYKMMEESDLPTVVERLPSPNGKIVAIVADRDNSFSGSIMRFVYIGPSHLDFPKDRGHFRLAMQGSSYSLHWETDRKLVLKRIHEGRISRFNPLIYLSEGLEEPILVKLESTYSGYPPFATPTVTPPFNPGDAQ
ncbi:MAG: hypothetical protein H3C47_15910 [Candidatus Cloacimonetes bacterium]|nr:hypothetical protein [Candidatus Cloacimonadota bacterium]